MHSLSARAGLILAALVCVATRLPGLRDVPLSDDEAIYDTMAREVVAGGVMYRDTVDHKPPGLTYTYAAVRAGRGRPAGGASAGHHRRAGNLPRPRRDLATDTGA